MSLDFPTSHVLLLGGDFPIHRIGHRAMRLSTNGFTGPAPDSQPLAAELMARALGVSHATVYRHFATKSALWEAVTKRWLDHKATALAVIAAEECNPEVRLRDWLAALFAAVRRKSHEDRTLSCSPRTRCWSRTSATR